jgi:hypothetical protein
MVGCWRVDNIREERLIAMSAIEKLKAALAQHPKIHWEQDDDSITVSPPNGFTVRLFENGKESTVVFDGWHGHFEDDDEAVNYFMLALSKQCRLQVCKRGKTEYKWTVQFESDNSWQGFNTTGLLLFPFWRAKTIEYRQNNLIDLSEMPNE